MTEPQTEPGTAATSLVELLQLEAIDENLFRGRCQAGSPLRAFGGQVAGQALTAAGRTVTDSRAVHSLHGYFVRPGDPRQPIVYRTERIRDGRSYSTRRVTAVQGDEVVFTLSASFKEPEETVERQRAMPVVPAPEELPDPYLAWAKADPDGYAQTSPAHSLQMRFVPPDSAGLPAQVPGAPQQFIWMRAATPLPVGEPLLQVCALTYLSDLTLASTTAMHLQAPRFRRSGPPRLMMASLDHAMWFHRAFRADEWLLFAQRSPSSADGRGLALGEFYDRGGALVASAVQEVLLRERRVPGQSRSRS